MIYYKIISRNLKLIAELKKKKECEKKALKIVDELIDGGLTENILFDKVKF